MMDLAVVLRECRLAARGYRWLLECRRPLRQEEVERA